MVEISGYQILREISASNRASVYLAVQESLEREVALKVMAPALAEDPAFVKRFLHEARTLASLAHPNIIAVFDVDAEPGNLLYFSMQYLPGGDFAARAHDAIGDADLVVTLDGVARALDYIHQRGLIHRDVSPGNVLYDRSGAPVLTDFGISRAFASAAGNTGTNFGASTGYYMSPEQARGAALDARSDLYSLGALTYFGLTGKPPFEGADGFAVAYAHVFEPIPRLPSSRSHWQKLIDRALAKDPAERFASAGEFLDALHDISREPAADLRTIQAPIPSAAVEEVAIAVSVPEAIQAPKVAPNVEAESTADDANQTIQRAVLSEQVAAPAVLESSPARVEATQRNWHIWAIVLILAGIAAIAAAAYTQFHKSSSAGDVSTLPARAGESSVAASVGTSAAEAPTMSAVSPANDSSAPAADLSQAVVTPAGSAAANDLAAQSDEFFDVTDLSKVPTVVDPYIEAVRLGRISLAAQRLTTPPGNNALEYFQFALKRDTKSKNAKQGIVDIAKKYIENADKSQSSSDLNTYLQLLGNADDVAKTMEEGADLRKDIAARRVKAAEPYLAQARVAAAEWDKITAKTAYERALQIDAGSSAAKEGLKFVATIGEAGFVFHDKLSDGGQGPPLIILGGGRIAAVQRDVTRGEFRRYWDAAGRAVFAGKEPACRDRESFFRSSKDRNWQAPGFDQDDSHPVVCIDWAEAAGYAQWLSRETGKRYRLLSVGEFDQLAARTASDCANANLADAAFNKKYASHDGASCDDGFAETAPVGHFEASGGVYDASGNVRVWVAACANGAAIAAGGSCRDYLAKGRAWLSTSKEAATFSDSFGADVALNSVGFRMVREIEK